MITLDENHIYRLDGQIIPGCSQILKSCGLSDYSNVPKDILDAASNFGTAVHLATALWDKNTLDMSTLSEPLVPYLEGWKRFIDDYKPTVLTEWTENPMGSVKYRFGCTPDRVLIVRDKIWVLDIKTTSSILPSIAIQTAAQAICIKENYKKVHKRVAIQLTENNYKLFPFDKPSDEATFLACLRVFNWKKENL